MDNWPPKALIIMKAGSHVGECLDCILKRKKRERKFDKKKRIFWGYGGNRLLPKRVQRFAEQWGNGKGLIPLLMALTRKEEQARSRWEKNPKSASHQCQPKSPLQTRKYYKDGETGWKELPSGVNVPESPYALVLDEVKKVCLPIDRGAFKVGAGPSKGSKAAKYGGKYWFDHVCLVEAGTTHRGADAPETLTITYRAYLKYPYAVFLK